MKKLMIVLLMACAMGCQSEEEMKPEVKECFECVTVTTVNRNDGYSSSDTEESDVHCGITAAKARLIESNGSGMENNFDIVTTFKTSCKKI